MALGNLVVRLGLDAAEFTSGLTRAEAQAQKFRRNLEAQAASIARIATGVAAVGAAVGAAVLAVDRLAKSAATFKDMEERTGASAESLASLAVAAETAGVSMGDVEGMMHRLTKALTGVDDESKAAGAALAAIGIPIEDFKRLDPVAQFEQIARALDRFADGSGKTAVAIALLGRSGAQALPFLRELAGETGRQTILTQAQIERADAYSDAQSRATAQLRLYAQAAATEALPAFTAFTRALTTTIAGVDGVNAAQASLTANNTIATWAENGARGIGILASGLQILFRGLEQVAVAAAGTAANLAALARGDIKGAAQIVRDTLSDMRSIGNRPTFSAELDQALERQKAIAKGMAAISTGNEDRLDRMAKRLTINFDGAEKKVRAVKAEVDDLAKFLQRLRGEEFAASIGFDPRTIEDLDKLAEASKRFGLSLQEQGRLIDLILSKEPRFRQEQEKLNQLYEEWVDQQRKGVQAAEDLIQSLRDEAGAVGLSAEALAKYNAASRVRDALKGVTDPTIAARIDALGKEAIALAGNNVARQAAAEATVRGAEAGRQIVARYQEELGAIGKTGLALEEYRLELERVAALTGVTDEAQRAYINSLFDTAKALAANLEAQRQYVDDAIRLNDAFRSSFADNIAAVADGTKSFKDAVKDMANEWVRQLNRMAAQKLGDALFGQQGSFGGGFLGDISKWFSGMFNFGGGGFNSDPFGIGGRAFGGMTPVNQPIMVGERGPEIFVPKIAGEIVSNQDLRKSPRQMTSNAITINIPPSTSRQSASQLGLEVYKRLQRVAFRDA